MSRLRPTLRTSKCDTPMPDTFDALYMIRDAVERRSGLIHGELHDNGGSCAIGSFFDDNPRLALSTSLVDQVAAYNDSMPGLSKRERRNRVLEWLTARIEYLRYGKPRRKRDAA